MNKCKVCDEPISFSLEICYDCKNLTKEEAELQIQKKNVFLNRTNSIKKNYTIYNMVLIPFVFLIVLGYLSGFRRLDSGIAAVIQRGFAYLFLSYYAIKIIMLFVNRLLKKKWAWPYGDRYFILPLILIILLVYLEYYNKP